MHGSLLFLGYGLRLDQNCCNPFISYFYGCMRQQQFQQYSATTTNSSQCVFNTH